MDSKVLRLQPDLVPVETHSTDNRFPNLAHHAGQLGDLTVASPQSSARSPLFDEPADFGIPGNVHLITDDSLARLIEHNGAINLLRQMAKDLAERDAQITELRKRYEEREKRLKAMLFESGVARSDIERRLLVPLQRKPSRESFMSGHHRSDHSFVGTLDDQLQEAMSDAEIDDDEVDSQPATDSRTPRPPQRSKKTPSLRSEKSDRSVNHRGNTTSSPETSRPRGASVFSRLSNGLFNWDSSGPSLSTQSEHSLAGVVSTDISGSNDTTPKYSRTKQRSDTNSFTTSDKIAPSLAPTEDIDGANEDAESHGENQLSSKDAADLSSILSVDQLLVNAKAERRVHIRNGNRALHEMHSRIRSVSTSRTIDSWAGPVIRDTAQSVLKSTSTSHAASKQNTTMEMATFIPDEDQPPTMLPAWNEHSNNDHTQALTDRYGFKLFDVRSKRREASDESKFANLEHDVESEPKAKTGDDEMLHGTGSNSSVKSVPSLHKQSVRLQAPRDSSKDWTNIGTTTIIQRPLTPETTLNKSDAVFSNEKSSARLLMLSQLDIYGADKAKQEQWDAFIQKTRDDRYKSRTTKTEHIDEHEEELLGVASMGTGKMGKERLKELHNLVLGGIPMSYRTKIWSELTGAYMMKEPAYYEELLSHGKDIDKVCVEQIDLDLKRTMPSNVFFAGVGTGVAKLRRVLLAFSRHNPDVGYCQGMNVIAATLLLIHPKEEDAFFALACIVEKILPPRYFTPDLLTSRADQIVLKRFVKELCPKVHKHMETLSIDLEAVTFGWFLSVFTDCLPVELLFRVWDIFFLEGRNYLFCVAITIVKIHERVIFKTKTTGQGYIVLKELTVAREINVDEFVKIAEQVRTTLKNKAYNISDLQKNAVEELIPPSPL